MKTLIWFLNKNEVAFITGAHWLEVRGSFKDETIKKEFIDFIDRLNMSMNYHNGYMNIC